MSLQTMPLQSANIAGSLYFTWEGRSLKVQYPQPACLHPAGASEGKNLRNSNQINKQRNMKIQNWVLYQTWEKKVQSGRSTCKRHCLHAEHQSKCGRMRGNRVFSSLSAQYLSDLIINITELHGRFQVDFSVDPTVFTFQIKKQLGF